MAWLVRDTTVLASLELADSFRARLRGLLGRDGIEGALLLRPARSVHTLGMRFAIDVAFCDSELRVLHITTLAPNRIAPPVRHACMIVEAEQGAFARWGLAVGDELSVHGEGTYADEGAPDGGRDRGQGLRPRPGRPGRPPGGAVRTVAVGPAAGRGELAVTVRG